MRNGQRGFEMTTEQIIEEVFRRVMQILTENNEESSEAAVIDIEKKFVTWEDVRDLAVSEGTVIRVPKKAVITDIALEYFAKKKVKLQRQE